MSELGLGCAKTPAVAPHVEISAGNCIPESQIIPHTPSSMSCWRIVFSAFRRCMSFHTGWVKSGKARSEHIPSGLPPRADIVDALSHFRFVPTSDICTAANFSLFDHFVGAGKEGGRRSFEAERFLRLEVDHQFVLGRRLNSLSFCSQRFSGFASMSDEELRYWAERTVLQGDNRGWIGMAGNPNWQRFERQVLTKLQHREWEHCEKAPCRKEMIVQRQGKRDNLSIRRFKARSVKGLDDTCTWLPH